MLSRTCALMDGPGEYPAGRWLRSWRVGKLEADRLERRTIALKGHFIALKGHFIVAGGLSMTAGPSIAAGCFPAPAHFFDGAPSAPPERAI